MVVRDVREAKWCWDQRRGCWEKKKPFDVKKKKEEGMDTCTTCSKTNKSQPYITLIPRVYYIRREMEIPISNGNGEDLNPSSR
jgi:hypothetical protein